MEANGISAQVLTTQILREPVDRADFEAKLRLFLDKFYIHLCDNSDAIGMLVYEIRSQAPIATDIITKYYLDVPKRVEKFLELAKERGIINPEINSGMVSDLILSKAFNSIFFEGLTRQLRGSCVHDNGERAKIIDQTMLIFTGGIYA